ncbi:TPA: hypothetical protein ACX3GK_003566 [Vibrio parahaemolyticus]|uniref:hypothetical protein n=1 Tax=Vibrio parahaemolyticus TaxID=670 RepID=UPI000A92D2B1|nr:hypothetical protein [Vibrio parahaemolyticus]MDF4849782.1 hypothetical protein [Vibrio parahaemolyticus]
MKNMLILILSSLMFFSSNTLARDDIGSYPIENALSSEAAKNKLGTAVKFYFGEQKFPKVVAEFGEFKTNKKQTRLIKQMKKRVTGSFYRP